MTHRERLLRRIQALLHHPPELALTIKEKGRYTEDAAAHLRRLFGEGFRFNSDIRDQIQAADWVASGANEYNFPGDAPGNPFVITWKRSPIVCHPLSGESWEVEVPSLSEMGGDAMFEVVEKAVEALTNSKPLDSLSDDELEGVALRLWRQLPDELMRLRPDIPWTLLPAETRIPDHPIWEHLSLTSALASAELGGRWDPDAVQPSQAALMLFAIGPVQGFVAAARKSRDLQAGSFLLSYLTWQAIQVICERFGPEALLFPDLRQQPLADRWLRSKGLDLDAQVSSTATIPNRFFAMFPLADVKEIGCLAERAVRDEFGRMGTFVMEEMRRCLKGSTWENQIDWPAVEQQVYSYFECYWTALPFHRIRRSAEGSFADALGRVYGQFMEWGDKNANKILDAFDRHRTNTNVGAVYGRLYRLTDALVGSRKALRDFNQVQEPGYRCSLMPTLPAFTPEVPPTHTNPAGTPKPSDVRQFWERIANRTRRGLLSEGEQLSIVALIKRYVGEYLEETAAGIAYEPEFPSTGSIATASFKSDVIHCITIGHRTGDSNAQTRAAAMQKAVGDLHEKLAIVGDRIRVLRDETKPLEFHEKPLRALKDAAGESPVLSWFAGLDGGWLFEEAYDAARVRKEYLAGTGTGLSNGEKEQLLRTQEHALEEPLAAARKSLICLLGHIDGAHIERPAKYYAVLQMDGDEMGKWLSGQKAPKFREALHPDFIAVLERQHDATGKYADWIELTKKESDAPRPLTPALHLAISRALGTFALDLVVRLVEEEHLGQLVFSGGDDVLAFVTLRDALPLAHRLRAAFSGQITTENGRIDVDWNKKTGYVPIEKRIASTMGCTASASAGLAITHYKSSLQQAVHEAHQACEDYAKETVKRDALAIALLKRSGEDVRTGTNWCIWTGEGKDRTCEADLAEAITRFAALVRGKWVASGYAYDLAAEREGLLAFDQKSERDLIPLRLEALRLFRRRSEKLGARGFDPSALPFILKPFSEVDSGDQKPDWQRIVFDQVVFPLLRVNPLDRFLDLLGGAQFIGQGGRR
jgi:CRISPR-associated protein Cmr2